MNGWLKRAWHDPVGSKVIAGVILAGLGVVAGWLWSLSNFSTNGALVWSSATTGLRGLVDWLSAPVTVSRLGLWIIICIGAAGWTLIAREQLHRARLAIKSEAREEIRDTIVTAFETKLMRELRVGSLTYTQRLMFHILCRNYPDAVTLPALGSMLGLEYPAAEKLIEDVAQSGFIETKDVINQRSNRMQTMVGLTKDGRNYCLENELNRPPASEQIVPR